MWHFNNEQITLHVHFAFVCHFMCPYSIGIVRSAVMGLSMSGEPSSAERCVICVSRISIIRIRLAAKEISLDLVSTR